MDFLSYFLSNLEVIYGKININKVFFFLLFSTLLSFHLFFSYLELSLPSKLYFLILTFITSIQFSIYETVIGVEVYCI